jgi:hypothetical protein
MVSLGFRGKSAHRAHLDPLHTGLIACHWTSFAVSINARIELTCSGEELATMKKSIRAAISMQISPDSLWLTPGFPNLPSGCAFSPAPMGRAHREVPEKEGGSRDDSSFPTTDGASTTQHARARTYHYLHM